MAPPRATSHGDGAETGESAATGRDDRRPGLVVFYQRPVEDPFHGGSAHARGFIAALSVRADIRVVAPHLRASSARESLSPSVPRSVAYILRATAKQLAFLFAQCLLARKERASGVVVFDVYSGAIPLIWSRVTGTKMVYYAQDYGGRVARDLREIRARGAVAFKLFRGPLESVLIHHSDILAVVSEVLRQDFVALGVPSNRIVTCEMPRQRVDPNPNLVSAWRSRLGLHDHLGIIFVGNLGYPPNRRAVGFIETDLVPQISQTRRLWKLILAGPGTDTVKVPDRRVIGLGPVVDLDNLLYACHIGIAPVEVEGGVSGKLVEYLTHGLVAVATREAASGMVSCESLKITEVGAFAKRVMELIDSDAVAASGAERRLEDSVVQHYLTESGIAQLVASIETSIGGSRSRLVR